MKTPEKKEKRIKLLIEITDILKKEFDDEKDIFKRISILRETIDSIYENRGIIEDVLKEIKEKIRQNLNYYLFDETDDIYYQLLAIREKADKKKDEKTLLKAKKGISEMVFIEEKILQEMKFLLNPKKEMTKSGFGTHEAEIVSVEFFDYHGKSTNRFRTGEPFNAKISYEAHKRIEKPMFGVAIHSKEEIHICGPNTTFSGKTKDFIEGKGSVTFSIDSLPLLEGEYLFSATLLNYEGSHPYDFHWKEFSFYVFGGGVREKYGIFYIPHEWNYD
ncbi:MAG: Wzt carbohydrate-binding domain-containing protein [Candidatus Woesearchaeota archaeon]|nr:Wzt carbohydrate-binding domain-containing protein [Candidatus Woesearchaeota archaeon]